MHVALARTAMLELMRLIISCRKWLATEITGGNSVIARIWKNSDAWDCSRLHNLGQRYRESMGLRIMQSLSLKDAATTSGA